MEPPKYNLCLLNVILFNFCTTNKNAAVVTGILNAIHCLSFRDPERLLLSVCHAVSFHRGTQTPYCSQPITHNPAQYLQTSEAIFPQKGYDQK